MRVTPPLNRRPGVNGYVERNARGKRFSDFRAAVASKHPSRSFSMTTKDLLRRMIESSHRIVRSYVADLTDAESLVRPVPGANHAAWQLGHMIGGSYKMLTAIGRSAPALPEGFAAAHQRDTCAADDPQQFAKMSAYLALMDQMTAASLAAVDATPEADFDKPGPESMRQYAPTVGIVLSLLGTHWLMHAGQFVVLRRRLGRPIMF